MRFLKVGPGMTVAEIGAGRGYYTVRLARRIGPTGRVIAEDIVPSYLTALQERIQREGLKNVSFTLGEPHNPHLPPQSVDLVFIVHTYHEIKQPYGLLYNLLPALRKNARVAIIDLDQPTEKHGTPISLLFCEVHALGFRQIEYGWLRQKIEYISLLEPAFRRPVIGQIKACSR